MPTATLTFRLPEEEDEFRVTQKAAAFQSALRELDDRLRGMTKYGNEAPIGPQGYRDLLHEILTENGVSLWE